MSKVNITPLVSIVRDKLTEFDAQFGGLHDYHLKWIKGYAFYMLGSPDVQFYFDNSCDPSRRLLVQPLSNGKELSVVAWAVFQAKLLLVKNKHKPLLHPDFWPKEFGLVDCVVKFVRMTPKEAIYDNQSAS